MQAAKKAKKARQQAKKREDAAGGSICTAQEEEEMERYFAEEAAALIEKGSTQLKELAGSPEYAAPEVLVPAAPEHVLPGLQHADLHGRIRFM